jgi:hypothetical protein
MPVSGIQLTRDGKTVATDHATAARELVGTGIWVAPVDLSSEPEEIKALLAKQVLTEAENAMLSERFTLSREALLETIALAGRKPHVADGGALDTYCIETATAYPAFRTIDPAMDFSAFVPFHVNQADDGTGTDEVGHVVSGDMKYRFRRPEGIYVLAMGCPTPDLGWRFTFDGGAPHGGLFDTIIPGTKVMVQAIGPKRFHMRYVD